MRAQRLARAGQHGAPKAGPGPHITTIFLSRLSCPHGSPCCGCRHIPTHLSYGTAPFPISSAAASLANCALPGCPPAHTAMCSGGEPSHDLCALAPASSKALAASRWPVGMPSSAMALAACPSDCCQNSEIISMTLGQKGRARRGPAVAPATGGAVGGLLRQKGRGSVAPNQLPGQECHFSSLPSPATEGGAATLPFSSAICRGVQLSSSLKLTSGRAVRTGASCTWKPTRVARWKAKTRRP
jgi:hypothetical protein